MMTCLYPTDPFMNRRAAREDFSAIPTGRSDPWWRALAAWVMAGTLLVFFLPGAGSAEQADPGEESTPRLLYQNRFVTLEFVQLAPGEAVDIAESNRAAFYLLDDGPARVRLPDGAEDVATHARGSVLRLRNRFRALHNPGEAAFAFLSIRSLVSPLAPDPPGPSEYWIRTMHPPPVPGDQGIGQVFDDETLRIIEIVVPPDGEVPSMVHLSGVYYALSDHQTELVFADGRTETYRREHGDTWWMDFQEYAIRNPGNSPMHVVFIGVKPVARYGEYEP